MLVDQYYGKISITLGGAMDIVDWLHTLNLSQYEAAFRENSVDMDVLPSLTVEDLKDLGITAVGHRRRLLNAIIAFRAGAENVGAQSTKSRRPNGASSL